MLEQPRLTVVLSHPVQYFSPLFDLLNTRGTVDLTVAYNNDAGAQSTWDEGFAQKVQWDIDLTGGHNNMFLTSGVSPSLVSRLSGMRRLARLIRSSDVAVVHGYNTAQALVAIALCTLMSVPFFMRADTSSRTPRHRVDPRHWWPRLACRLSSGALAVGERNARLMTALGCRRIFVAPFAVDNERFKSVAERVRADPNTVREHLGLPLHAPIVAYAGKFTDGKRPGDLIAAQAMLDAPCHILMIGDGPSRQALEASAEDRPVTFVGFLNQGEMPLALASADVVVLPSSYEPWGLIINEAMACGCVPLVSDAVGCAPDLVAGLGEIYPAGDVAALALALEQALRTSTVPGCSAVVQTRVSVHSLERCAAQYESAVRAVWAKDRGGRRDRVHDRGRC